MHIFSFTRVKILIAIIIAIVCIIFRDRLQVLLNDLKRSVYVSQAGNENLFTSERLANYNGKSHSRIYLSILGSVFDVTKGIKHYGKGGPYNYFAGKDGSRAFITGDFQDESESKDHVSDLSCTDLLTLSNWKETLKEKYMSKGHLIGRYYDNDGQETEYTKQLQARVAQCELEKAAAKLEDQKLPPCNVEWNADSGTRVWCSKTSGGVKRNWVGVPRQLYTPGKEHPRCVCVNLDQDASAGLLKEYDNCPFTSIQCTIKST